MKHPAPATTALLCLLTAFGSLAGSGCVASHPNGTSPLASRPTSSNLFAPATPAPRPVGVSTAVASASPPPSDADLPVPVVELRGPAVDLGTAHGRQLAGPIKLLHEKYLGALLH